MEVSKSSKHDPCRFVHSRVLTLSVILLNLGPLFNLFVTILGFGPLLMFFFWAHHALASRFFHPWPESCRGVHARVYGGINAFLVGFNFSACFLSRDPHLSGDVSTIDCSFWRRWVNTSFILSFFSCVVVIQRVLMSWAVFPRMYWMFFCSTPWVSSLAINGGVAFLLFSLLYLFQVFYFFKILSRSPLVLKFFLVSSFRCFSYAKSARHSVFFGLRLSRCLWFFYSHADSVWCPLSDAVRFSERCFLDGGNALQTIAS